jgi:AcrR family transcriptional regulator
MEAERDPDRSAAPQPQPESGARRPDERRARGERSRQAILQAALATLGDLGLEGFTARRVAERAGVSTATLFHHFGSLDELQLEAVVGWFEEAISAPQSRHPRDLHGYLRALGRLALRMMRERPELVRLSNILLAKFPFSPDLQRNAVAHYARYTAQVEAELEALGVSGQEPERRRHAALALVLLLDGLGIHWSIHHDLKALERFWDDVADLFADQLGSEGPRAT